MIVSCHNPTLKITKCTNLMDTRSFVVFNHKTQIFLQNLSLTFRSCCRVFHHPPKLDSCYQCNRENLHFGIFFRRTSCIWTLPAMPTVGLYRDELFEALGRKYSKLLWNSSIIIYSIFLLFNFNWFVFQRKRSLTSCVSSTDWSSMKWFVSSVCRLNISFMWV